MKRIFNFTLVELIFIIGIALLSGSLLLPALQIQQAQSKQVSCVNNLKMIGQGVLMYAKDNMDHLPLEHDRMSERHYFPVMLKDYIAAANWLCPEQRYCSAFFDDGRRVNNGQTVKITDTAAQYKVSYAYTESYDGQHDYKTYSPCQGMDITDIISPSIIFACSNNVQGPDSMFGCGPYATRGNAAEWPDKIVPRSNTGVGTCRLGSKYLHGNDQSNFLFSDGHVEALRDTTFQQWMTFL